ncbi:PRD domain-containing protein [Clostridioides difficile]|nr:PRD domain-containing protein [Clostridioides difficile]MDN9981543.1 PRD domain-containing protein [Clostridioides difficile]MDO0411219.1 PRD domain-containing protein [Clostridioides difficile]
MIIEKILNNNVIITTDENHKEIVVMGRGLAYKKRTGEHISKDKIDKIFKLSDPNISDKFKELIADIPIRYMELSDEIILYAKEKLGKRLNDSIYISLTDHMYTAIERAREGVSVKNVLLWDIKRFYKSEFKIGLEALDYIEKKFEIRLSEDEAGFIALHIVNAQMDQSIKTIYEITQIIQEISNMVKYHYRIVFDEDSVYYHRFITHLKYFAERIVSNNLHENNEDDLLNVIKVKYKNAYKCIEKLDEFIHKKYNYDLTDEEKLYLTIHVDTKSKDGKRLFTPGHFDLIIIDESHRSIYKKYKSIFDYFDSYLMGLTATPKDEIDKNTYSVFDMENGVPTYAYEYNKAVEDGYLVDYTSIEFKTKIMEDGIKYDELSDEEKEEYENTFNDDESIGDEIGNNAVNEWLFNSDTIDLVLNKLMTEGLKIEGEEKIGKTIIFAKNTKHARAIVERFNKLYPKYGGNFVKAVDYSINYVDSIIDDFSDKNKLPQIAVSVDMLDTGIDIPEILNLVFFKKVRSKTKFWQMIGRGTRLCPDLLGVDMDKERFLIFDFCNNFEFFKFNPKGFEGNKAETLTEKLFNIKVSMVKELQDIKYIEGKYAELRKELLEELITSVKALNEDSYIVRMNLSYVHKYKNENVWSNIGAVAQNEIREYISPLITSYSDDELAKRFDVVMYNIQLAYLQNNNASKGIRHVMVTAEKLSKLGTIPQIQQQKYTIEKAMTEDFWEDSDIFEVEEVRISLRELIKYLEKSSQKIYYTSFEDMIVAEDRNDSVYNANNLKNYKKKVEYYLNSHKDELAIFKLRNNKKITKQDVETLEEILLKQLGNCDDYKKEFGDTPVSQLVRKLVGLDREAANEAFSEFLNNKSFNTKQIHFVKLIVDYVVKNGFIEDNKVLMEDPFRTVGSIIDLFENHIEERNKLIKTINKIKENASEIG